MKIRFWIIGIYIFIYNCVKAELKTHRREDELSEYYREELEENRTPVAIVILPIHREILLIATSAVFVLAVIITLFLSFMLNCENSFRTTFINVSILCAWASIITSLLYGWLIMRPV